MTIENGPMVRTSLAGGQFRRRKPVQAKPKLTDATSESMIMAEQFVAVMGDRPNGIPVNDKNAQ